MSTEPDAAKRRRVLELFAKTIDVPAIDSVHQRGRDADTARFTLTLTDGRSIRIGTVKVLRSQTQLGEVLNVAVGSGGPNAEQKDWRKIISLLFKNAVTVQETNGETFDSSVREWILAYSNGASRDQDGAAAHAMPFLDDDNRLNIHVDGLRSYLRAQYGEQVKSSELWPALADLGFERATISYTKGDKRTSRSYYRTALTDLEDQGT